MSKDLQLSIRVNGNQAAADVRRFTSSATGDMRKFTTSAGRGLNNLSRQTKQLWQDFNGFSTATKLFAAAGGLEAIRRTLSSNLNFERDLLEMKQNAGMTIQQTAELRQLAMDAAKENLQFPDAILQGEKAYARAGMKFDEIRNSIAEAARSATVMRASVEQIANMDFDLQNKFGLSANDMKAAHNMAYYHGNEGRFETSAMAQLAPVYLNALKGVGVKGMEGWNFTGALTQSIMKSAPATEPSQVATLIEQGLGHIAAYAKDLREVGINVKKYGPKGQFGAEGILNLAEAMKAKGLNDIFKLEKAGIRDQEAKKFWLQMMADSGEIRKQMGIADQAAKNDRIGADLAEIKSASFGKIMAAEIQGQKLTLSEGAQSGTSVAGNLAGYVGDHMAEVGKATAAVGGLYLLNRFNKNRKNRMAGEAASLTESAKAAQTQNVFVTNWPASMMSPGEKIRSRTGGNSSTPDTVSDGPTKGGKLAKAGKALGVGVAAVGGWDMGFNVIGPVVKELIDGGVQALTNDQNATLGTALYDWTHKPKAAAEQSAIKQLDKATLSSMMISQPGTPSLDALAKLAQSTAAQAKPVPPQAVKLDTGGELHIKINQDGQAKVVSMKTNDPRMNYNVDAGLTMTGAR